MLDRSDRSTVLKKLAEETLSSFERISQAAEVKIAGGRIGLEALANVNQITAERAQARLDSINDQFEAACRRLLEEPAIARVVVKDENGARETIYVARAMRVDCGVNLCSYLTPKGRLAAIPIGQEEAIRLPGRGEVWYEVLERAVYRPIRAPAGWDSRNTVVQTDRLGPLTVQSLRAMLDEITDATAGDEDGLALLDRLIAEGAADENVHAGIRREALRAMELRDQPLLDQFQDAIFRMPLDSQLVILGPPGTGKTTTLIRRLKQKIDPAFLNEEERSLIEAKDLSAPPHSHSWLMFTPTDLLKLYVKEAFAREDVAAPETRIRTWAEYRRDLARNVLPILRSGAGGTLILNENSEALGPEAVAQATDWFDDFDAFQRTDFLARLVADAELVAGADEPITAALGQRLVEQLRHAEDRPITSTLFALRSFDEQLRKLDADARDQSHRRLRSILALEVKRDAGLLDDIGKFAEQLHDDVEDDLDELEETDTEEPQETAGARAAAQAIFLRALRVRAVSQGRHRPVGPRTANGRLLEWLDRRGVAVPDLTDLGRTLIVQRAARRLLRAGQGFVRQVPLRYRGFRRERAAAGSWYRGDAIRSREVASLEVDAIILAMLRNARAILTDRSLARRYANELPAIIERIRALYRNQVLVDEAPDFSPVQLACMAALTNPATESFFACGDFNQRLTQWGSRSQDQLKWVYPRLELKPIRIAYRQSQKLNELAHTLVSEGGEEALGELPADVEHVGVPPVLGRGLASDEAVAEWLVARISEIERFHGKLPSTAVLVTGKSKLEPLASKLNAKLQSANLRAVACHDGMAIGTSTDIRVFEVEHIKGLEFEAVFFLDIDALHEAQPDLFEKYLYVGATRAATFLGLTMASVEVPSYLMNVAGNCAHDWTQYLDAGP